MARGVNKVILLGNLGKDPESRVTQSGADVASFSVATSEQWTDKQTGQKQERTEWHNCTAFGRLAGVIGQYLVKGSKVYIEGQIRTEKYQGRDGQDRYATKIIVREMQMLDSRGGAEGSGGYSNRGGGQQSSASNQNDFGGPADDFDDDIPF